MNTHELVARMKCTRHGEAFDIDIRDLQDVRCVLPFSCGVMAELAELLPGASEGKWGPQVLHTTDPYRIVFMRSDEGGFDPWPRDTRFDFVMGRWQTP